MVIHKSHWVEPLSLHRLADTSERQLQLVYPQLVTHWRKAGNKLKTINYLIHAAESAVALGNTMQVTFRVG